MRPLPRLNLAVMRVVAARVPGLQPPLTVVSHHPLTVRPQTPQRSSSRRRHKIRRSHRRRIKSKLRATQAMGHDEMIGEAVTKGPASCFKISSTADN